MRWWVEVVSCKSPVLQRAGGGIRVLAIGGKSRRGMVGAVGDAVMEDVGTWWRTLGPMGGELVGGFN